MYLNAEANAPFVMRHSNRQVEPCHCEHHRDEEEGGGLYIGINEQPVASHQMQKDVFCIRIRRPGALTDRAAVTSWE